VYGHFSDFTKSDRSPAKVCRWMAINQSIICCVINLLTLAGERPFFGFYKSVIWNLWLVGFDSVFLCWDNCTLLGSWPAIIPWEYRVWRMNKSCCYVLQYNTEVIVLVLQNYFGKWAILCFVCYKCLHCSFRHFRKW
jgi:hypothetical protein